MAVEIIAEIAQGYEGDPALARRLAQAAVRAGADAVKFQLVIADELATPDYEHYALFRHLEMPREAWRQVMADVREGGARCYLDVFGEQSLREAHALGADGIKIHSTDFFNTDLVRLALELAPRIFLSLGGILAGELEECLRVHRIRPEGPVCLMYGFQADPTPLDLNHLARLGALRARFPGYRMGFMDHTDGAMDEAMTLALLALPYGVVCLEKHLTLDRALKLEDFISALEPEPFGRFVQRVRRLEPAIGTDRLELTDAERAYRRKTVKAVVARRTLKRGDVIGTGDLALKRTAHAGSSVYQRLEEVVGRAMAVDVQPNEPLTQEMLA